MIRSILIGLDGSGYSRCAVALGIAWAKRYDALLVGLGIVDEPAIRRSEPTAIGGTHEKRLAEEAVVKAARREVEQRLSRFAIECSEAGVTSKVLENTGTPYEEINREAQRYDIVFLGRKTFFDHRHPDRPCDTLIDVLKASPRPVVTVPEGTDEGGPIVAAYDGSVQSAKALQILQLMELADERSVEVVSVAPEAVAASRCADGAVEFLRDHGVEARGHPVTAPAGATAEAILDEARRLQPSLLVMGAFGRRSFRELLLGSVTSYLLDQAPVPLFLYH